MRTCTGALPYQCALRPAPHHVRPLGTELLRLSTCPGQPSVEQLSHIHIYEHIYEHIRAHCQRTVAGRTQEGAKGTAQHRHGGAGIMTGPRRVQECLFTVFIVATTQQHSNIQTTAAARRASVCSAHSPAAQRHTTRVCNQPTGAASTYGTWQQHDRRGTTQYQIGAQGGGAGSGTVSTERRGRRHPVCGCRPPLPMSERHPNQPIKPRHAHHVLSARTTTT